MAMTMSSQSEVELQPQSRGVSGEETVGDGEGVETAGEEEGRVDVPPLVLEAGDEVEEEGDAEGTELELDEDASNTVQ